MLQFCSVCEGYKAPRSHHCRKCERCVMKMDHHCPWIAGVCICFVSHSPSNQMFKSYFCFFYFIFFVMQCVGWNNHAHFTSFLAFSVLGCIQSSIILGASVYRGIHYSWYVIHNGLSC